jgi:hypothetical protein
MTNQKQPPIPYVPAEIIGGHLVRVCPECKQEIGERTDDEGRVSNHFAEHYEAEHAEHEPERARCYVLGWNKGVGRNLNHQVLRLVRERLTDVNWELVLDWEDVPEGAHVLLADQALWGMWGRKDAPPEEQEIRWFYREGDKLVFFPSQRQTRRHAALLGWALRAERRILDDSKAMYDEDPWFATGLLKVCDVLHAQVKVADAKFDRGHADWGVDLRHGLAEIPAEYERLRKARRRRGR